MADDLDRLRADAAECTNCDLYKHATQTVFGEGPAHARIMLVGEQPGDQEDVAGHPFVGPAGRLLDKALAEAGIPRGRAYVTNAVKHFKWVLRGKKRLHQKPKVIEIKACAPWLEAEIETVKPHVVVAMGATAARSLLGPGVRVTKQRGVPLTSELGTKVVLTVHPSSLLREPDPDARARNFAAFVADLRVAAKAAQK
jgi:DNA polymerase